MKHAIVGSVYVAVLAVLGITAGGSLRAADSIPRPEVADLISQLGSDQFALREFATEQLIQMGLQVIPYVEEGSRHFDREIRYRCQRILTAIVQRDRQQRMEALLAGDSSDQTDLPGWTEFRAVVGDDLVCRQLYVEMLRDEWDMLTRLSEDRESLAHELSNRCLAINESQRVFRQTIPLGTIATVLFLASEDGVAVPDATGQQIFSLLYQGSFRAAIGQRGRRSVLRAILGRWIERDAGEWTTHYSLNLSLEHDLKAGLKPATRVINNRVTASHIRQYGILVIAKLGGEEHHDLLTKLFDDQTVCSRQQLANKVTYQTQIRDIALAALLHLKGEDLREFGFERVQLNARNVFNPTSLGFKDEEARAKAFEKWKSLQAALDGAVAS